MEQRDDQQADLGLRLGRHFAATQIGACGGISARHDVGAQVAVRAERALGRAGGAAGVEDRRIVLRHQRRFGGERDVGQARPVIRRADQVFELVDTLGQVGVPAADDGALKIGQVGQPLLQPGEAFAVEEQDLRPRIAQAIVEFAAGPPRVERDQDRADTDRGKEDHRPFGRVAHRQRDAVALHHPHLAQLSREVRGGAEIRLVGDALILMDGEDALAMGARQLEQRGQVRRGVLPHPRLDAANLDFFHFQLLAGRGHQRLGLRQRHLRPGGVERDERFGGQGGSLQCCHHSLLNVGFGDSTTPERTSFLIH